MSKVRLPALLVSVVVWNTFFTLPAAGAEEEARLQAAKMVAGAFLQELVGALQQELAKGDPAAAVKVCTEVAPAIANRLSREHGWSVTRVGTRVRNPLMGMPDAYEQQALIQFAERAGKGEKYLDMIQAEVVTEPNGRYFRFLKPIAVAPQCLLCHGSAEQIPAEIQAILQKNYPHDQAIGYQPGDLRGAVSIKQPLDISLTEEKSQDTANR
jgi:hypothetical protein